MQERTIILIGFYYENNIPFFKIRKEYIGPIVLCDSTKKRRYILSCIFQYMSYHGRCCRFSMRTRNRYCEIILRNRTQQLGPLDHFISLLQEILILYRRNRNSWRINNQYIVLLIQLRDKRQLVCIVDRNTFFLQLYSQCCFSFVITRNILTLHDQPTRQSTHTDTTDT